MATAEEDLLKSMYEYSLYTTEEGKEYVVRGAKVVCAFGTTSCCLNLPKSHGVVTADGRPLITYSDSGKNNVSGFNHCTVTEKACKPDLTNWSYDNNNEEIYNNVTLKREKAVTKWATADCKNAEVADIRKEKTWLPKAVVTIQTSGQVIAEYSGKGVKGAKEVDEDKQDNWKRGDDGKDFFAHFKSVHAGIYNFGVYALQDVVGTVFLYKKEIYYNLKYVGAYELLKHEGEQREGFSDEMIVIPLDEDSTEENKKFYWTVWAEIMLEAYTDYYIEIDCPNFNSFAYRFIGNREQFTHIATQDPQDPHNAIIGSVWVLDDNYNLKNFKRNYESYSSQKVGVPVMIFHLSNYAKSMMRVYFQKVLDDNTSWYTVLKNISGDVANILGIASLLVTVPSVAAGLSVLGLIVSNLPRSDVERIYSMVGENADDGGSIVISDCQCLQYGNTVTPGILDVPEKGAYYVYGAKYLKGRFAFFMQGYTTNDSLKSYVEIIDEAMNAYLEKLKKVVQ